MFLKHTLCWLSEAVLSNAWSRDIAQSIVPTQEFGPASIATARGPQECVEHNQGDTQAPAKRGSESVRGGTDVVVYNVESNQLLMKEEESAPTGALILSFTMFIKTETNEAINTVQFGTVPRNGVRI